MRMMKAMTKQKTWWLVLLLAVSLLLFAACNNTEKEQPEEEESIESEENLEDEVTETEKQPDSTEETSPGTEESQSGTEATSSVQGETGGTTNQEQGETALYCTISISCATVLDNMEDLAESKASLVPSDGWILAPVTVEFSPGDSAFTVLQQVVKDNNLHMEYSNTPAYQSAYIEGIGNLYEFDCGPLSGWMYSVNGWFPNYACSEYELQDGDDVAFLYSCDLGEDVGGNNATGE